jgi:hypothetical protein
MVLPAGGELTCVYRGKVAPNTYHDTTVFGRSIRFSHHRRSADRLEVVEAGNTPSRFPHTLRHLGRIEHGGSRADPEGVLDSYWSRLEIDAYHGAAIGAMLENLAFVVDER